MLVFDFQKDIQIRSDKLFIKPHHFRHYGNRQKKMKYIFYEVGTGETLELISQRFQIKMEDIQNLNQLSGAQLEKGQILRLR
ncbi:MAG: LysM peptidoglycan-binding domain-containing protein, partial [Bacteroidota bacterium]